MTVGEKLTQLRILEGHARGLGREMTQSEVSRAIRAELHGTISQSYLSQLESGKRPHMTGPMRLLLARFFKVHPGHLVDDPEDGAQLHIKPRRDLDDRLDIWLIEGSEAFVENQKLSAAILAIAKHPRSRDCLQVLASIVENRELIERLLEAFAPTQPSRARRRSG